MISNCEKSVKMEELHKIVNEWIVNKEKDLTDLLAYRQMNEEEWVDREVMCYVLREDVLDLIDCSKLSIFESDFLNITSISFVNVQETLKKLTVSMEKRMNEECRCENHWKFCGIIEIILRNCKNSMSQQTYEQMFNYLMKLIETCDHDDIIDRAWEALLYFEFSNQFPKYQIDNQSSLLHLINLMENKLNEEKQRELCFKIGYEICGDSLSDQTRVRVCDYIVKLIETCEHKKTICYAWFSFRQFSFDKDQSSLIQVVYSLMNNLQSPQHNWKMHQNWCWLINEKLIENEMHYNMNNSKFLNQNLLILLFDYFKMLLEHCDHVPVILSIVWSIEQLYVKRLWGIEQMNSLKGKLLAHLYYGECNGGILSENVDFDKHQVDWCVRWCMDNVMEGNGLKELPLVKLSQDGFEARNDNRIYGGYYNKEDDIYCPQNASHPVCSAFSVSHGIYYYEVTIVTSGEMMFGWCTRDTRFIFENYEKCEIGQDEHSIGFDVSRKLIYHNSKKFTYPQLPDCEASDVIGCLIDCDAQRFVFYYKGHVMQFGAGVSVVEGDYEVVNRVSKGISFSFSPYYATALLSYRQQCHFNFGQSRFKFAPKDIRFSHFLEGSSGDGRRCRLNEPVLYSLCLKIELYWFKRLAVDNEVDLFFTDQTQNKFDEDVKSVGKEIQSDQELENWGLRSIDDWECVRYIQSIIEVMWKVIEDDKFDVVAQWIGKVIEERIDEILKRETMLELLYPYLQLRINSAQESKKHRYICIVLLHLIKYSQSFGHDFLKHIRSEVFTYLTLTVTETSDDLTTLFALLALDNLKLSEEEKNQTQRNIKLNHLLGIEYHQENVLQILNSTNTKLADYQVYVSAQLFKSKHKFSSTLVDRQASVDQINWKTPLNASDQSKELKLSRDQLSARSDWEWQSVRSTSCEIDYYEAFLLTSGSMRIGWATKRTNLDRTEIGDDKFSIALDGYNQCVWHNKIAFPVRNMSRWKAGDIVGCYFDKIQRAFHFSLNGQPLAFDCTIYICSQPYYAATSLYYHQQCYY